MENFTDQTVDTIVENNTGLVYTIAGKFKSQANCADFDDCVSAGLTGLLTAANKVKNGEFDPERAKLSTFLSVWITAAIRRELVALNDTVRVPESALGAGVERVACGSIPEEFDVVDTGNESELSTDTEELLSVLSPEDKTLLIRHTVNGETLRELAEVYNVSRETIRKRVNKALESVRNG